MANHICNDCNSSVPARLTTCPYCNSHNCGPAKSPASNLLLVIGAAIFGTIAVQYLPSTLISDWSAAIASVMPVPGDLPTMSTAAPSTPGDAPPPVQTSGRTYSIARYANIRNAKELGFDFSYRGANATLLVRNRPADDAIVILQVDGRLTCSSFNDGTVAVKFDDDQIRQFSCAEASDGSESVLFIRDEMRFVRHLKQTRSLTIKAEFFGSGRQQLKFDAAGSKWS